MQYQQAQPGGQATVPPPPYQRGPANYLNASLSPPPGQHLCATHLSVGRPQCEVIPQQLHDEGGVLVAVFAQRVQLGDGVVERLLGQLARLLRRVQDLVVEDGEVERQTEPDRVRRLHLALADLERVLVRFLGVLDDRCNGDHLHYHTDIHKRK